MAIDLDLPNMSEPSEGIICSGQPSPEQFQQAAEAGVSTVINLRGPGEGAPRDLGAEVTDAGMHYVHIPITGAHDLTEAHARDLAAAINGSDGPVLIHCGSSNRVGALLALKVHYVDGLSAEDAVEYGLKAGMTGLASAIRDRL